MSERGALPEAIRRALDRDHRPVRPLRPVIRREAVVFLWLALLLAIVPLAFGVRGDANALGLALVWGAAALEGLAGLTLVALALREAVPGAGVAFPARLLALLGALATQMCVAIACWLHAGSPGGLFPPGDAVCFPLEASLGIPALALTVLLVARAYAVRPAWAGLLGGAGAGLATDGVWHLVCRHVDLAHVLLLHCGAVLALAAVGWLAGCLLETARRRERSGPK